MKLFSLKIRLIAQQAHRPEPRAQVLGADLAIDKQSLSCI